VGQVGRNDAAPYELDIDIRTFELDVSQSRVKVDFAAKLVASNGGRTLAARVFTAEIPVASTAPAAVSAALDSALSSVMTEIVAFVSRSI